MPQESYERMLLQENSGGAKRSCPRKENHGGYGPVSVCTSVSTSGVNRERGEGSLQI